MRDFGVKIKYFLKKIRLKFIIVMTIYEASTHLYNWFAEKESFCMETDYSKMILISDEPEVDKAAVLCSLDSFVELNIVKTKEIEGNNYWVLNKKFETMEQTPSISPSTAIRVYNIIKAFSDITGDPAVDNCNILDINGRDIEVMLDAVDIMIDEKK